MARNANISKSNLQLTLEDIAKSFKYRNKSLKLLFSNSNPNFSKDFQDLVNTSEEVIKTELKNELREIEKDACLNLLASIEAKFRLDYIIRCKNKHKDEISREFRSKYLKKGTRISLEKEILDTWKKSQLAPTAIISNLIGAFKYRHWLAHGRYWVFRDNKYDFLGLYILAEEIDSLPLKS